MSFTDGKARFATEKDLVTEWNGQPPGEAFRCYICGYRFRLGDYWRWVYANYKDSGCHKGNFTVCENCDGPNVLQNRANLEEQYNGENFWSFKNRGR